MRYFLSPVVLLMLTLTAALQACDTQDSVPEEQSGEEIEGAAGGDAREGAEQDHEESAGHPSAQREDQEARDTRRFEDEEYSVRIEYPAYMKDAMARGKDDPQRSAEYGPVFAGTDEPGEMLLNLEVPEERAAQGEAHFVLAANREREAITHCVQPPREAERTESGDGNTEEQHEIDGVPFTYFETTEVDGESFRSVRSYRTTYTEACYAIDLVLSGDGEDDQFDENKAFEQLQAVLDGFEFTE